MYATEVTVLTFRLLGQCFYSKVVGELFFMVEGRLSRMKAFEIFCQTRVFEFDEEEMDSEI